MGRCCNNGRGTCCCQAGMPSRSSSSISSRGLLYDTRCVLIGWDNVRVSVDRRPSHHCSRQAHAASRDSVDVGNETGSEP